MGIATLFGSLVGVFPVKWPDWARQLAATVAIFLAVCALAASGWAMLKWSIIGDYEDKRATAALPEYDNAAEDRANDAIRSEMDKQARELDIAKAAASEAAKPPSERATVAPQTRAFNCAVMRQDYSERELAKMDAYQRECGK